MASFWRHLEIKSVITAFIFLMVLCWHFAIQTLLLIKTNPLNLMQNAKECLIIDDDPDDQEIFVMCLKKINKDINCTTMNNGVDAITMLMSSPDYTPDYIFIDVNMPKMNGIDCLRTVKNIARLQYSRIFMYSTTSEGSVLAQSRQLGAEDFIIKPSSMTALKGKLSAIFEIVSEIDK